MLHFNQVFIWKFCLSWHLILELLLPKDFLILLKFLQFVICEQVEKMTGNWTHYWKLQKKVLASRKRTYIPFTLLLIWYIKCAGNQKNVEKLYLETSNQPEEVHHGIDIFLGLLYLKSNLLDDGYSTGSNQLLDSESNRQDKNEQNFHGMETIQVAWTL
jgi:hypothetical protein